MDGEKIIGTYEVKRDGKSLTAKLIEYDDGRQAIDLIYTNEEEGIDICYWLDKINLNEDWIETEVSALPIEKKFISEYEQFCKELGPELRKQIPPDWRPYLKWPKLRKKPSAIKLLKDKLNKLLSK